MRLFVGVVPPEEVREHLAEALAPVADEAGAADSGLRWIPAERWHLTLTFLGDVEEEVVPRLARLLDEVALLRPPLELAVAGAGRFGDRVLWVGVGGDLNALGQLARATTRAAREARVTVERRRYHPHLTVARSRSGAELGPAVEALAGYRGPAWPVEALQLVRSHLGPEPRYQVLGEWRLAGGPEKPGQARARRRERRRRV